MDYRYFLFLVTFFVIKYFTLFNYYTKKLIGGVLRASSDIYREYTTKYVYLRYASTLITQGTLIYIAT